MKTLKFNNQTITKTFENTIFQTYNDALHFAINTLGWNEDDILERYEDINVEIDGEDIKTCTILCITNDTGSDDYIFFLEY